MRQDYCFRAVEGNSVPPLPDPLLHPMEEKEETRCFRF